MKKILLIALILGAIVSIAGCYLSIAGTIKGSGKIVSRTVSAPDFDRISSARAVKVTISDTLTDKIFIEADDNIIDDVITEVSDGELKITIDNKLRNLSNTTVRVTVPANGKIRGLEASSASKIVSEVTLSAAEFEMDASSAAAIEATVNAAGKCSIETSSAASVRTTVIARECTMDASSASKIDAHVTATDSSVEATSAAKVLISGSAQNCNADIASAASLKAGEFVVENYTAEASSGSSASINCTKTINIGASSGASIRYTGEGTGRTSASSGGSVRKN